MDKLDKLKFLRTILFYKLEYKLYLIIEVMKIYYLYIIFIIMTVIYTMQAKNRDLYIVSILGSIIYFLPCFFGYVRIKYSGNYIYEKIDYRLYIIHVLFIIIMLIFHRLKYTLPRIKQSSKVIFFDNDYLVTILNYIWLVMFIGLIFFLRDNLFLYKTRLPGGLVSYYVTIYNLLLVYTIVSNYKFRRYKNILLQIPSIIVTIIQGHRSYLVFILLAIIINEFVNNKINLFKFKYIVFTIFTGIFGFTGKLLIGSIRQGFALKEIIIYLLNFEVIVNSITNSEPFITQYILNKTIITDFRLDLEYLIRIILKLFFVSPNKVTNIKSFYNIFTNRFYPNLNYGIAYNIFSEPYAIAGMIGVIIFIILFGFALNYIDNLIRSSNGIISSLALSLASIYTFYIFRNSIENIILWTQILFLIFFICYFFQLIKYKMKIKYTIKKINNK